ncbi:phage portal protein [Oharaeibacter diazotrophicus]|uniref:HK97 family phage portal protein n=1 Tax=Oharaeibacter diazotrophicus TaxID=1920512 RepID=A0A4R6RC36_9HYPH|nr:phage portal protein [Oharaeibacter diazotrophicus]TDP83226.1 HK97 family phage portal protein [Oharaeibacter diazotrophicus]BBE72058.1 phage portal protein [Pleomorphomonas sp. SM30]GLS78823.1 portal protein [Oharaeibacter diazotrophicus]
MPRRWFAFTGRRAAVPEEKASRAGPLIAWTGAGRPAWTPRDYGALAREGYQRNPFVHRAVRLVAEGVGQVPLVLTEGGRELDAHPALDLLARPNGRDTRTSLLEAIAAHLQIAGNAYVELVAVDGRPAELHVLRPDRVRVVPGADGWPEAYDYSVGGRTLRIPLAAERGPAPVLHLSAFNPLDDHYGLAPLEAAQVALDVHNTAAAWNKALLDNAARPSGALVYSGPQGLSDDQFERLRRELEEGFQGARNAGRPMLLEGGLDWKTLALTPREMDFVEARNMAAREIALAFGVPPMLLGIPGDATYANYQEANRALWRQTVLPLSARIAEALGGWLLPAFGDGLTLAPDLDQVSALHGEREALWRRIGAASFLTEDEKRAAVGYGPRAAAERGTRSWT